MKAAKFMVIYALLLFGAWLAFNDLPDPQEAADAMTIMIVGSMSAIIVYWILRSGLINRPSEWGRGGGDATKDHEEGRGEES